MTTEIDLGVIIDAIVNFAHEDYGIDNPARDRRGDVSEWAIDLAMEIADALEPGGVFTASVPRGNSSAAATGHMLGHFVHGIQESHGTPLVGDMEPE